MLTHKWFVLLCAGLALAGFSAAAVGPAGGLGWALIGAGLTVAAGAALAWRRERSGPYDLRRLYEEPPCEEAEPIADTVAPEARTVYCAYCDAVFDQDRHFCPECGRHYA